MGSKGKSGKKIVHKGRDYFEAAASGHINGRRSGYAQKKIDEIRDARSGKDAGTPKKPIVDPRPISKPFERSSEHLKPAEISSYTQQPIDMFKKTKTMATAAYFGAASLTVEQGQNIELIGDEFSWLDKVFEPTDNSELRGKPCRLMAKCVEEASPASVWELSRVIGLSGKIRDTMKVRANHTGMGAYLRNWEREILSSFKRADYELPADLKAVMVNQLDAFSLYEIDNALQDKYLQEREATARAKSDGMWDKYSGIFKANQTLVTAAFLGAARDEVRPDNPWVCPIGDNIYGRVPLIFISDDDATSSEPCRLVAKLTKPNDQLWELSRVMGLSGEKVETRQVQARTGDMLDYLKAWEKSTALKRERAECGLPEGLAAIPVSEIDQSFLRRLNQEARDRWIAQRSQSDGPQILTPPNF